MKILVTGDSWAAGHRNQSLQNQSLIDTDFYPVLVDLLKDDGNEVLSDPHPGESDLPSLVSIKKYIKDVDFVIFFKTEISRLLPFKPNKKTYDAIKGIDWPDINELHDFNINADILNEMLYLNCINFEQLLIEYFLEKKNFNDVFYKINQEKVYKELQKNSQKILLIGGIERINTEYQFKYVIEDLVEYLTGYRNDSYTMCSSTVLLEFKRMLNEITDLEVKNNFLDETLRIHNNNKELYNTFLSKPEFFGPKDKGHPNKNTITLYYKELIKPKLEEFKNDNRTAI